MRRLGTDKVRCGRPAWMFAAVAASLMLGCHAEFTGPYPCKPDYASCINRSANTCETNTAADGLNCGSCGAICGVGAACVGSTCGQPAARLATLGFGMQTPIETNSSAVFWSMASSIFTLAGSAAAGTTPTTLAMDGMSCNTSGPSFAVDDANVYYWSTDNTGCTGTGACSGLTQVSLADGTRTLLLASSALGATNSFGCGSFAVAGTFVYLLASQQQSNVVTYTLYRVRIGVADQASDTLITVPSYNGPSNSPLAINSTALFFEITSSSGAPSVQMVPLSGAPSTALPIPLSTYGSSWPFVVDDANVYGLGGGCSCNNNSTNSNASNSVPPAGSLVRVPLGGGAGATLATFSGEVGGLGVDSTAVYWSTDTTAWKVPLAGGGVSAVAGNLSNGVPAFICDTCSPQSAPSSLAVSPSFVYIAVNGASESAILKVAK